MCEENFDKTVSTVLTHADLEVVVELQKAELDRLLRENAKLHERVIQLLSMQEREQILRQQMQTMLGHASTQQRPAEKSQRLEHRAQAVENRYGRLKDALSLLVTAIERQKT